MKDTAWRPVTVPIERINVVMGGPPRPELSEAERVAKRAAERVGHFDWQRERGWSDAEMALGDAHGLFPSGGDFGVVQMPARSGRPAGQQRMYSRARLAERAAAITALATKLAKVK